MMLLWGLAPAIVAGLATGGRLRNLAEHKLRFEWLLLPLLAIVAVLPAVSLPAPESITIVFAWMLPVVVCMIVAAFNIRQPGFFLVLVGLLLNFTVVAANMAMPVHVTNAVSSMSADGIGDMLARSWLHEAADAGARLLILADVIPVPGPGVLRGMVSLGDILIVVGISLFVFVAMHEGHGSGVQWMPTPEGG